MCNPQSLSQFTNGTDCDYLEPLYAVGETVDMLDMFMHKYLPDIDGNSFSGRWRAFLRSGSIPMKATIYTEWHDARLVPWVHFVPMDNSFADYHGILEYFAGFDPDEVGASGAHHVEGHDEAGREIAEEGRSWAKKVLRHEDMLVYMHRLILEYARVTNDERGRMGWADDLIKKSDDEEYEVEEEDEDEDTNATSFGSQGRPNKGTIDEDNLRRPPPYPVRPAAAAATTDDGVKASETSYSDIPVKDASYSKPQAPPVKSESGRYSYQAGDIDLEEEEANEAASELRSKLLSTKGSTSRQRYKELDLDVNPDAELDEDRISCSRYKAAPPSSDKSRHRYIASLEADGDADQVEDADADTDPDVNETGEVQEHQDEDYTSGTSRIPNSDTRTRPRPPSRGAGSGNRVPNNYALGREDQEPPMPEGWAKGGAAAAAENGRWT